MTTTTDRSKLRRKRGFSLAEVLVATAVGGIVLAASTGSLLFLSKSTAGFGNYQEMNMTSRFALEIFASDARMTVDVNSASATTVSLQVYNAAGGEDTIVYAFDQANGRFTRLKDGVTDVLLDDVQEVDLSYFTLRRVETTMPLEIKEIQLIATMRRSVLSIFNTNEIISARFMMRNRSVSSG